MDQKTKIKNILEAIKLDIVNIDEFKKDIDSILSMFDEIKDFNVNSANSALQRKKIHLTDLREDTTEDWGFKLEMRGKYYKVPNVSKK